RVLGPVRAVFENVRGELLPAARDAVDPRGAESTQRRLERLPRFQARRVARERLFGALEFAYLQEVDVHVESREELVAEQELRRDAGRIHAARWAHPELRAASRGEQHRAVVVIVGVAYDGLARAPDRFEHRANLGRRRDAD